ncbi:MAG: DUF4383 domain-containing protein [Chloroflexota bacterium]|nr:DUF4383 domain-containing protein [Chloroflexota bacterium]
MPARLYAQVTGVVLLVLGVIGLFVGDRFLSLNSSLIEDIVHIAAGAIAAYAGFVARDDAPAIMYARVFGVVYLLLGILGFIAPRLFGLFPAGNPLRVQDHIVHILLGLVGLAAGFMSQRRTARI